MKIIFTTLAIIFVFSLVIGCTGSASSKAVTENVQVAVPVADASPKTAPATSNDDVFDGKEIVKTDAEWKQILTPEQYHTLREAGTDPASDDFGYTSNHEAGDYYCAACHLKVFSSKHKFESGTGWPSFTDPIDSAAVTLVSDRTMFMTRTEVRCRACGGHLGHVFNDGPAPSGQRYCMNSASLRFIPRYQLEREGYGEYAKLFAKLEA